MSDTGNNVTSFTVVVPEDNSVDEVIASELLKLERAFFAETLNVGVHDHRLEAAIFGEEVGHINDKDAVLAEYIKKTNDRINKGKLALLYSNPSDKKSTNRLMGYLVIEKYLPRLLSPQENLIAMVIGECHVVTELYIGADLDFEQKQLQAHAMLCKLKSEMPNKKLTVKFLKRGKAQNPIKRLIIWPLKPLTKEPTFYDLFAKNYKSRKAWRRTAEFPVAHENLTCEISSRVQVN